MILLVTIIEFEITYFVVERQEGLLSSLFQMEQDRSGPFLFFWLSQHATIEIVLIRHLGDIMLSAYWVALRKSSLSLDPVDAVEYHMQT